MTYYRQIPGGTFTLYHTHTYTYYYIYIYYSSMYIDYTCIYIYIVCIHIYIYTRIYIYIWVSPSAVHPPGPPPDLRITRHLQHLEALRLQLPANCCIWEKPSLLYTLFAIFGSSQALNCVQFPAFGRSQALSGCYSHTYHIKTYDPYRPYLCIYGFTLVSGV